MSQALQRVTILGGGIAGLAAAYELEKARLAGAPVDWQLVEASARLGGVLETTRHAVADGEYILEGGPDGWVGDKPWARDLAVELGLESEIIASKDRDRKTWIVLDGRLEAIPDGMRMMVPTDLEALDRSNLFSAAAREAFRTELVRAAELKAEAPEDDESVSSFVSRHFGPEVLNRLGAPLLSGIFGGDVERLSVQAVMPAFVKMEREHGSLIRALQLRQASAQRDGRLPAPTFETLRSGMGLLVDALVASLPPERVHLRTRALSMSPNATGWSLDFETETAQGCVPDASADHLLLAVPVDAARMLLNPVEPVAAALLPMESSSAVLACFCWPSRLIKGRPVSAIAIPAGFGFLNPVESTRSRRGIAADRPPLLAATFVDQKFPDRTPSACHVVRAFFGAGSAEHFVSAFDVEVAQAALAELRVFLGAALPDPEEALTVIRRWPRSLPQYEIGHLSRMAELESRVQALGRLHLLGNGYRGVGIPDLIRDSRAAARSLF